MTNPYNNKQAELARKRRAMYYSLHINKGISGSALARRFGMSHQRMNFLLRLAAMDAN